ncbi:hypothetical protein AVEN_69379-1 [Araneus ventricosus]|uniref:Uncharacterized protein n=1 Tax=Araneus ventricosus TaxID=182803 RepID=A0A4Y2S9D5_ARAVE|nr:hypothetical protein AVEN_69379-1 [Araneus ventricosus]
MPAVRRRSHRLNLCGKARKANNGEHVHGAAGGRHYSRQSQSEHCTGVGNIRWQCSSHRPAPTGLSQIVFAAGQEEMRVAQAGLEQKMEVGQEEMRSRLEKELRSGQEEMKSQIQAHIKFQLDS